MGLNKDLIRIFSLVSVLFLIFPSYYLAFCESDVYGAGAVIESAEETLASAYLLVVEAERAGGDVSSLVEGLNMALEGLNMGRRAFEAGDFERAWDLASKAVELGDGVGDDAVAVRHIAEVRGEIEFRNRLFIAFEIVYFVFLFGFFGWSLFKGHYLKRMRGMRPEVVLDEP